jgi:hypothetical protein
MFKVFACPWETPLSNAPRDITAVTTPNNFVFIASPLTSCLQWMQAAITKWNDRAHERAGFGTYLTRAAGRGLLNAAKVLLFVPNPSREIATNYRRRFK